jgi:hypothetical protein
MKCLTDLMKPAVMVVADEGPQQGIWVGTGYEDILRRMSAGVGKKTLGRLRIEKKLVFGFVTGSGTFLRERRAREYAEECGHRRDPEQESAGQEVSDEQ